MLRKMVLTIGFVFIIPTLIFGQSFDLTNFKNASQPRQDMINSIQYNNDDVFVEDSVRYDYEKSPAKAFLMSAIIPGAGEIYTGHWGRAAAFMSMEVLFWSMHFVKNNEGYDLEDEYKKDADSQWSFDKFLNYTDLEDKGMGPDGSHQIWAIIEVEENGEWVPVDESAFKVEGTFAEFEAIRSQLEQEYGGRTVPIRTRDFYENIGKYRQFAAGWDDFDGDIDVETDEDGNITGIISSQRNKYLSKREDSNNALKMASTFSTAVIVNHVISAFHAQIMAKNYDSQDVTWNINLLSDVREKYLFNGINFSINF